MLLTQKQAARLKGLLAKVPSDVPIYVAEQAVLDAIAGFNLHRGILALGRKAPELDARALLTGMAPGAVVLVLMGIGNHDNVGAAFRNAAAFGADAVLLDERCCDPLYRKAIRVSVGAALRTPYARVDSSEMLDVLNQAGFTPIAFSPQGKTGLAALPRPTRSALILGAEGPGLDAALLERAAVTVAIPMADGFDSLNVATTSGIALHHLRHMATPGD